MASHQPMDKENAHGAPPAAPASPARVPLTENALNTPTRRLVLKGAHVRAAASPNTVISMQREMQQLRGEVKQLSTDLINQTEDNKMYKQEFDRIQDEGRKLFTAYTAKQARLKDMVDKYRAHEADMAQRNTELARVREELTAARADAQAARDKCKAQAERFKDNFAAFHQLQQAHAQLKASISDRENTQPQPQPLQEQPAPQHAEAVAELEQAVHAARQAHAGAEKEWAAQEAALRARIHEMEVAAETMTEQLVHTREAHAAAQAQLSALSEQTTRECAALRDERTAAVAEKVREMAELNALWQTRQSEWEATRSEWTSKADALQQALDLANNDVEQRNTALCEQQEHAAERAAAWAVKERAWEIERAELARAVENARAEHARALEAAQGEHTHAVKQLRARLEQQQMAADVREKELGEEIERAAAHAAQQLSEWEAERADWKAYEGVWKQMTREHDAQLEQRVRHAVEELAVTRKQHQAAMGALTNEIFEREHELEAEQQRTRSLTRKLDVAEEHVDVVEETLDEALCVLNDNEQRLRSIPQLEATVATLTARVEEFETLWRGAEGDLHAAEQQLSDVQRQRMLSLGGSMVVTSIGAASAAADAMHAAQAEVETVRMVMGSEITALQESVAALEAELEVVRGAHAADLALAEEHEAIAATEHTCRVEALQGEVARLSAQVAAHIEAEKAYTPAAQQDIGNMSPRTASKYVQNMAISNEVMREENTTMAAQLAEKDDTIAELRITITAQELQQSVVERELATANEQRDEARERAAALEGEAAELRESSEANEGIQEELTALLGEIETQAAEAAHTAEMVEALQTELAEARAAEEHARTAQDAAEAAQIAAMGELAAQSERADALNAEVAELRRSVDAGRAQLAEQERMLASHAAQAEERLGAAQSELDALRERCEQETRKSTNLETDLRLMYKKNKKDLADLESVYQHENYKARYERQVMEADDLRAHLRMFEDMFAEMEEIDALQETLASEAAGAAAQSSRAFTELSDTREAVAQAEAANAQLSAVNEQLSGELDSTMAATEQLLGEKHALDGVLQSVEHVLTMRPAVSTPLLARTHSRVGGSEEEGGEAAPTPKIVRTVAHQCKLLCAKEAALVAMERSVEATRACALEAAREEVGRDMVDSVVASVTETVAADLHAKEAELEELRKTVVTLQYMEPEVEQKEAEVRTLRGELARLRGEYEELRDFQSVEEDVRREEAEERDARLKAARRERKELQLQVDELRELLTWKDEHVQALTAQLAAADKQ